MHRLTAFLAHKAYLMRKLVVVMTTSAGFGYPTSALSAADIVATLFFGIMRFDPANSKNPNNDRFILSKGHAVSIVYAVWHELGRLTKDELMRYGYLNSLLEGYSKPTFWGNEAPTGLIGHGLSIGLGMALGARLSKRSFYTYVLLGDGESAEGLFWEAAALAAYYKVDTLIAFIDVNRLGQNGPTMNAHFLENYAAKFKAFGWEVFSIDGHDHAQIFKTSMLAKTIRGKPTIIIAKTYKGFGVASVQNKEGFHGKPFKSVNLQKILEELEHSAGAAANNSGLYDWQPTLPEVIGEYSKNNGEPAPSLSTVYEEHDLISSTQAFGNFLPSLGQKFIHLILLDNDVKNLTAVHHFSELFPDRFIEAFMAPRTMIGMAMGLSLRGKIALVATLSTFLGGVFEQLRSADLNGIAVRIAGAQAGISVGHADHFNRSLDDIALLHILDNALILCPCDAISTQKLMVLMMLYDQGISYLRLTDNKTPLLYSASQEFEVGGFSVVRSTAQDTISIIAIGGSVFEALKAYEQLLLNGISVRVVDLYCIKPLNEERLKEALKDIRYVITVEDHYLEGGMGQIISYALRDEKIKVICLAIPKRVRLDTTAELSAYGIDAHSLIRVITGL